MLSMGRRRRRGKCYSPQEKSEESKPMNILLLVSVEKAAQCACCRGGKSSRLVLGQLGLSTTSQLERSVCKPTIDLCTNKLGEGARSKRNLLTHCTGQWQKKSQILNPCLCINNSISSSRRETFTRVSLSLDCHWSPMGI